MSRYDRFSHYRDGGFFMEHGELEENPINIKSVGWTLGNSCPFRCKHCYSMNARLKGADIEGWMVDRIVAQLVTVGIKAINLGGNEPLFTNGYDHRKTMLPTIIEKLAESGINIGLTTSGITLVRLSKRYPSVLSLINDVDISLDSPYENEHNSNRGANLYETAIEALGISQKNELPCSIIMCGMSWNFLPNRIIDLVRISERYGANIRINTLKITDYSHLPLRLSPEQYFIGFSVLMNLCHTIELGEAPIAALLGLESKCSCGQSSFRIHSITPDGKIPVSPSVYLHDYKVGNLLTDDLDDIIKSPQFQTFRRRNKNPDKVEGCEGCNFLEICRGGCACRAYLEGLFFEGKRTLFSRDPYCLRDKLPKDINFNYSPLNFKRGLVHQGYLCTWIGRSRLLL